MRQLTQPGVLLKAMGAGAITALACYPRLMFWEQPLPVWFLEVAIFLSALVLWAFVFAWHQTYTRRPAFTFKVEPKWFALATLVGLGAAAGWRWLLDPGLRVVSPLDYPGNLMQWLAMVGFALALNQLLLVFAPFDWLMRLSQNRSISVAFTMLLGVVVLVMKARSLGVAAPASLMVVLLSMRIVLGICAVVLYLQGGVMLVWWCGLLVEARHLLDALDWPW